VSGKAISILNRKGGVSKTTTAIALGDTLVADYGNSVVLVDLDPQASASQSILDADEFDSRAQNNRNLVGWLNARASGRTAVSREFTNGFSGYIRGRDDVAYAIVPNSESFWDVERALEQLADHVVAVIDELKAQYDYVLIDCPPGQTSSVEGAVRASDLVLCPIVPEQMAVWGQNLLRRYIHSVVAKYGRETNVKFVVTRFKLRREHRDFLNELHNSPDMLDLVAEAGRRSQFEARFVVLKEDVKLGERPHLRRPKTFDKIYGNDGANRLRALARAVKKELGQDG
jgi:chromosome partitioning protein